MDLNIFKRGYLPWRYPRNIKENIENFFRNCHFAWQRATRGYADCDIWNMDCWLLSLIHDGLIHLADNNYGWPGDDRFPEPEDWDQYLRDMAQKFYQSDENNEFYPTPETDKLHQWYAQHPENLRGNPYRESFLAEDMGNSQKRQRDFAEAWSMMGDVFWNLWD